MNTYPLSKVDHQLQASAVELSKLFEQLNLDVKISNDPAASNNFFQLLKLPETHKVHIYKSIRTRIDVAHSTLKSSQNPNSSRVSCWAALKSLGLRPTSDLMDRIGDNQILEIYSANLVQIYSNLNFWSACSYSLDDLFSYEFFELFHRDESLTKKIIERITHVLKPDSKDTIDSNVEDHELKEIFSLKRRRFQIKQGILSPLFSKDSNSPVAFIATLDAKIIQ